jgi:hypothetical protein
MLSQLLRQLDALLPENTPVLLVALAACLGCLAVHYLLRLRERRLSVAAAPQVKNASEDRAAGTLRRSPVPVLVTDAAAVEAPVPGYVVNRSTDGMVVEMEEEGQVDPGTQLKVRPTGADQMVPWVLVEVNRRQKLKSCWQLDCRYVRTPPYSVRMLFG